MNTLASTPVLRRYAPPGEWLYEKMSMHRVQVRSQVPRHGPCSLVMSRIQTWSAAVCDQLGPDPGRVLRLGAALADLLRERQRPGTWCGQRPG